MARFLGDEDDLESVFARRDTLAPPAPAAWEDWLYTLFPSYVTSPFARRHEELWDWIWTVEEGNHPRPFVAIWPRGGAKSTTAEVGAVAIGCRGKRRYIWYICETQEQADTHVANIAAMLESSSVGVYYPKHADRMIGKFGQSKGWRRNRLRTAGGLTVDALGLDTASRGLKVEEQRPDFIVLDDIDGEHDSPATTAKKIATITTAILPAGATDTAVLAVQNLIRPDGVFGRMESGRADYLADRIVSGPFPAVEGLVTEWVLDEETQTKQARIVAGTATWEGQDIATCQRMINRFGLAAFLKECQHMVKTRLEGVALRFDPLRHLEDMTDEQAKELVGMGQAFGGIDFGAWRFAFTLRAADRGGRVRQVAEYFSQRDENLRQRARAIHALLSYYGAPNGFRLWGDAANPTDITEINAHFADMGSPYRVVPVAMENKIRAVSVERMNELLDREALLYRRDVHLATYRAVCEQWRELHLPGSPPDTRTWLYGYNAASPGEPMSGSRLQWEIPNWSYPVPKEGEAQDQNPDDETADGADMIAAERYAIMSWWKAAKPAAPDPLPARNYDRRYDERMEQAQREQDRQRKAMSRLVKRALKDRGKR
jgi:hypothetical protein